TGGSDRGISPSTTESSGGGIGDRRLAVGQRFGALPRSERPGLPALCWPWHPGPQSAGPGQAPACSGRGRLRGSQVQTKANRLAAGPDRKDAAQEATEGEALDKKGRRVRHPRKKWRKYTDRPVSLMAS